MDHLADRQLDYSPEDAEEERRNFLSVLKAFRYYRYVNAVSFSMSPSIFNVKCGKNNVCKQKIKLGM